MQKGSKHSEETKKKMKKAKIGKKLSVEHKKSLSKNNAHYWKDKKFSKKHRENLRISHKGKNIGSKHPNWKGGIMKQAHGYIYILKPNHPFAIKHGYILRSHLVIEKYLKRYLKHREIVHHINEIITDDRPENLMAFKNVRSHIKFHNIQEGMKPNEIVFNGHSIR